MAYQRGYLGQDEDVIWPNVDWSIPGGGAGAVYTPPIDWGTPGGVQILGPSSSVAYPTSTSTDSGSWNIPWGGIKDVLVPLSTAAANIIRSVTGQPPQPGTMYNPKTGQYVLPGQGGIFGSNWLLPALLLGGGAILLMRRKKG